VRRPGRCGGLDGPAGERRCCLTFRFGRGRSSGRSGTYDRWRSSPRRGVSPLFPLGFEIRYHIGSREAAMIKALYRLPVVGHCGDLGLASAADALPHSRSACHFCRSEGKWCLRISWSGTGSNCRPSAFQVNRAKRYADLQKRTSLTSGTALGGRCNVYASSAQYTPSTRQDSAPTQDHRPVQVVPLPSASRCCQCGAVTRPVS